MDVLRGDGLLDLALGWLAGHLYLVVFLGVLVDASGLPFPGRLLLVAAGAMAHAGHGSAAVVVGLAVVAAMAMDLVWYLAGRWGSERLLGLYRRLTGLAGRRGDPVVDYFVRYGAATVVLGRFFSSVRVLVWPMASRHGVGYAKFLAFDLLGAALWASLWVVLGWIVGESWQAAAHTAGGWTLAAGAVLFAGAAIHLALRLWRRRRSASG